MRDIKIGDKVVCLIDGVSGVVIKKYFPTACEEQTMIETRDGRLYHAPTRYFERVATKAPYLAQN
jgi:hypothetical protein